MACLPSGIVQLPNLQSREVASFLKFGRCCSYPARRGRRKSTVIPVAPQLCLLDSHGVWKLWEMRAGPSLGQPLATLSLALSPLGRKLLLSRVLMVLGLQPQEDWPGPGSLRAWSGVLVSIQPGLFNVGPEERREGGTWPGKELYGPTWSMNESTPCLGTPNHSVCAFSWGGSPWDQHP